MEKSQQTKPATYECIIHSTSSAGVDAPLISPQNFESWLTLLEAAKVWNHHPILDLAKNLDDKEIPAIFYHRKCRSLFTMKKDLESMKRKASENAASEAAIGYVLAN